ncbi:MAG: lysophospholipid acyltransferase family protein [Acidobacteria bacterium]|nr:lysophospholipid acyltransferase family protein [Acidobacteriota bacterium]
MRKKLLTYYGAAATLKFFSALPLPVAYALAHAAAAVYYFFDRRYRPIGLINLRIAFPERSESWRDSVLRRSYKNLSNLLVEVSKFPKLTPDKISRRVSYTAGSLRRYLGAKQKNSGVLFLTAHMSAWELLPFAHALYGYPLSFVVRPIDNPDINKLLERYREKCGNRVIPKRNALRALLTILRRKGDVGILIDQNVLPSEGVFVPLFGKEACTTNGPAMIALRAGTPVLPGFILPDKKQGHYLIHFGEEIPLCRNGSLEENVRVSTERFNQILEDIIRMYPDCWLWVHKRWKARPAGDLQVIYP